MKIEPRKKTDKGGYLCMPLRKNAPKGHTDWKLVQCPVCGSDCWSRPEDAVVITVCDLDGACCTECALKK